MSIDGLLQRAQAGQFVPVCLLVGTDALRIERTVAALKQAALGDGPVGFNDDVFHGGGLSAQAVINAARTLPMMAASRFVLVRHLNTMAAAEQEALAPYFAEPNPETCLVLITDKLDGRSRLGKAAREARIVFECEPPRPGDMPALARSEAAQRGHALSPEAATALSDALGPDLAALSDAMDRLSLFVGEGKEIGAADVAACVAHTRTESIWALVDAVGGKNASAALAAVASLLDDREPPLRILPMVARQLRMIARTRDALATGLRPQEAAAKAGAPPFKAQDLAAASKRFDDAQLRRAFRLIAAADLALKGSKVPGPRVLEQTVLALCRG